MRDGGPIAQSQVLEEPRESWVDRGVGDIPILRHTAADAPVIEGF